MRDQEHPDPVSGRHTEPAHEDSRGSVSDAARKPAELVLCVRCLDCCEELEIRLTPQQQWDFSLVGRAATVRPLRSRAAPPPTPPATPLRGWRCARCGGARRHCRFISIEQRPPAKRIAAAAPVPVRPAPPVPSSRAVSQSMPGRLEILTGQQARAEIEGRHAADAQLTRRRARRLCENIDEGIGRAAAAMGRGGADRALLILGVVREAVIEIADGLGGPVDAALARRVGRAGVRGAASAHLALRAQDLLEQLDVQLSETAVGDRPAEQLARKQALALLTVVNELATVAAGSRPGRESHPHRHSAGRRQTAARAPATAASGSGPH
jgi:hypothetical protein